jgi:hypothetical protein
VGEHAAEFHFLHRLFQRFRVCSDALQSGVVAFLLRHLEQVGAVAQALVELGQRFDDPFQRAAFLAQFLGALGVIPDRRVFQQLDDFGQAFLFGIVVKDTSAGRWPVRKGFRAGWRWR